MKVQSAAIVGESHVKHNLWTGSVASGAVRRHLRTKAVCRQFCDRSLAQEAEGIEKGDNAAA
jgi:hypothetical protein